MDADPEQPLSDVSYQRLSLGMEYFDTRGKNQDELLAEVIAYIETKIAAYQALPENLRQIPDLSLTNQIRTGLFGLFDSARSMCNQIDLSGFTQLMRADTTVNKSEPNNKPAPGRS